MVGLFRALAVGLLAVTAAIAQTGNPPSEWDINGAGSTSIQGFTTDISVNVGETVHFKVNTTASAYRLDIYRMGYYGGNGALKVATVRPSISLPQTQPPCLTQSSTGLVDCGNWAVSVSWAVPVVAKSGIYFAKAVRESGTAGSSHIFFVVRNDASHSEILFQTSDTTWQAYNQYGGNSLYAGSPAGRAYKISYNRPFTTRGNAPEDWVFNAEYPMVRWLEANGYDVSYTTGVDTDRRGELIRNHKVFMSVGHDEYWSANQRANVEAARNAGVHLAFFSGNEVFWKIRWENSISASADSHRTLVCYKETHANAKIDPTPIWTGTWRDPRFSPPADGGRPENGLMGTIFTVNCCTYDMKVPAEYGQFRFWRNTSIATLAPGTQATLPAGVLGYEWDEDLDNGARPPGLIHLSETTVSGVEKIQDYGSTYAQGTATHHLTLYRHASGALVFGAGTVQWSWGLDSEHDRGSAAPDIRMQQATVNLLADMDVQPATLQPGLLLATKSTDLTPPLSVITSPAAGSNVPFTRLTITGTASDSSGAVAGVEVSVDGGTTWRTASGRENWSYVWTPSATGPATIMSRAFDDSGNAQTPPTSVNITIGGTATCPCTIFGGETPGTIQDSDLTAVEVGVKFRSDVAGYITGIRFYKGPNNTGTHIGSLWSLSGTRLAFVTFTNETASGWQQASFASPVAVSANTTYVASYHAPAGRYSADGSYFNATSAYSPPLRALQNGIDGTNGIYKYGSAGSFPTDSWNASNYWVDVVFTTSLGPDATPPVISSVAAAPGSTTATITWTTDEASSSRVDYGTSSGSLTQSATGPPNVTSHSVSLTGLTTGTTYYYRVTSADTGGNSATSPLTSSAPLSFATTAPDITPPVISAVAPAPGSTSARITWNTNEPANSRVVYGTSPGSLTLNVTDAALVASHSVNLTGLTAGGTYYYRVISADASGNSATSPAEPDAPSSFATSTTTATTIFADTATPGTIQNSDIGAVELGVKFRSDTAGYITGIRFYKGPNNTGTHIGSLWSLSGTRLAFATFTNETASGWQQVSFASPVAISANTTYIASYHAPAGRYSIDENYFTSNGIDNPPLHALQNGVDGSNGVYTYGSAGSFPASSWNASNYWVDVVFTESLGPDNIPPVISSVTAAPGTSSATITWTTDEASSSRVDYGTSSGSLTQSATGPPNVTSHSVSLTGLTTGTTYYYRVTSADTGGNSATSPVTSSAPLSFATTASDITPPVISAVAPAPGSTSARITWNTNEPANSRVVYGTSPGSLTLNVTDAALVASHSVNLTGLTAGGTYYYRVISADGSGNSATSPVESNAPLSFATSTATATTIFSATAVPGTVEDSETNAVEIGMKFRSDVAASVTAIRFYKGPNNTGTHVGNLWTRTGTLLASVTFTNETASGWQQADLPVPVNITPGTTYVVSYHAPNGRYSFDSGFFASSGIYSPPLYALRNSVDGGNGVYRYGASAFPNQTYQSSNYWVDVVVSTPASSVSLYPTATAIETGGGTLRGGTANQLAADDDAYYALNSTTSGTRTVSWYATFNSVPRTMSSLKVAYVGKNSRSCTETVSIWNWITSNWVQLSSNAVAANELLRSNLSPSGTPGDYVSGTSGSGDVRVRVRCTTTANFNSSADLLSITYEP